MRSILGGSGRASALATSERAKRAAGPKSNCPRATRLKAMAGTPRMAPSIAAATVPEYMTSSARFAPWLMPETMRAGRSSFRRWLIAR